MLSLSIGRWACIVRTGSVGWCPFPLRAYVVMGGRVCLLAHRVFGPVHVLVLRPADIPLEAFHRDGAEGPVVLH